MSSDIGTGFTQDPNSGLFVPLISKQVMPWSDLGAQPLPVDQPQMSNALVPTVSAIVAQGTDRPRLLSADKFAALRTYANFNAVATLTDNAPISSTTFSVDDTSDFRVGDNVVVVAAVSGGANCVGNQIASIPDVHTLKLTGACSAQAYKVGDLIRREPILMIRTDTDGLTLTTFNNSGDDGFVGTSDAFIGSSISNFGHKRLMVDAERPWVDVFQQTGAPGAQASIALTSPGTGQRWVINFASWSFIGSGGTTAGGPTRAQIIDGNGKVYFGCWMFTSGPPVFRDLVNIHMPIAVNTGVTIQFTAAAAGVNQDIAVGLYAEF